MASIPLIGHAASLAAIPIPVAQDVGVVWHGDFDGAGGTLSGSCGIGDGFCKSLTVRNTQIQLLQAPNPVAEGQTAGRFEVQYGDVYPNMSDSRALLDPSLSAYASEKDEFWYRWQVYLPNDYISDYPKEDELGTSDAATTARRGGGYNVEWHHEWFADGWQGSAPVYFGTMNENFTLCINSMDPSTGNVTVCPSRTPLMPLVRGKWVDWLVHARWSTVAGTALLEVWADSGSGLQLLATSTQPNIYRDPTHAYRNYWEVGVYRNGHIGDPDLRYQPCDGTYPGNLYACSGPLVYPNSPGPVTVAWLDGFVIGKGRSDVYNAPLYDAAPNGPNPAIATLSDAFAGTTIDTTKWAAPVQSQGAVTESGGSLHLTPNANTASAQVYLQSNSLYSLIGSAASVQVQQVVSNSGGVDNNFALVQDAGNAVAWWYSGGTLTATRTTAGVKTTVVSLPYSASAHAFWRIRESGGTVYWETSADGTTWASRGSTPTSNVSYVSGIRPMFYSETLASSASPGEARYAKFNGTSPPPPPPATIAYRAASTYTQISASTMSMDLVVPASVQANDVLVASIYAGDYVENFLPSITPPAGWTLLQQVSDGTRGILQIYSKTATASDAGSTASWTTDIWVGAACSLLAYSGASAATPIDTSAALDNASIASTYSTPSATTTAGNDVLVTVFAAYSDFGTATSWSVPTGTTQRVNVSNTKLLSLSNDDAVQVSSGASSTFSSTASAQQTYALTAVVALKPGP